MFYDNSILPGTKINFAVFLVLFCFTITQFFQVLKSVNYVNNAVSGFTITQFFQVLKSISSDILVIFGFTITQFFQVLKSDACVAMSSLVLR